MKLLVKSGLILCLLLPSYKGATQEFHYLQGTIGSSPVAMRISCYNDTDCSDTRYYYKKTLKDIVLEGTNNGNHYTLGTSKYSETAARETFDLQLQPDQSFTGTWTCKGKNQPVKLKPIDTALIKSTYKPAKAISENIRSDSYEYLRFASLSFIRDSVTKYKDKELVWLHEKGSDMSFFRLGNGFSPLQRKKINTVLDNVHITEAMNQLTCSGPWGGTIEFTVNVGYLNDHLLGFNIFSSWNCGGAHPDFGGTGYLLGLNTGKQFDLDDILAFDASVTTEAKSSFDKYSQYRHDFFASKLMALMIKVHGFEKPANEDDCDYTDQEIWDFPSWEFTEKGILFTPIFGRAMRACEDAYLLTFDQLRIYKNPEFPYTFPVAAKK
jgi:hypothetical protein